MNERNEFIDFNENLRLKITRYELCILFRYYIRHDTLTMNEQHSFSQERNS